MDQNFEESFSCESGNQSWLPETNRPEISGILNESFEQENRVFSMKRQRM